MKNLRSRRVALTGVLFALALVLSLFEGLVAGMLGLPPGVKPGLANIVVMFSLLCISKKQALLLVLLKAGFSFLVRGVISGVLSFAGGMLSIAVMALLLCLPGSPSVLLISVLGAISHNLAQMMVVGLLFGQAVWVYAPVLLVSGVVMGCLTALLLKAVLPSLQRAGFGSGEKLKPPLKKP